MRDPVFVNPDLVLMGDAPGGVGLDSFSLDEEGRRRGGIVDLDVDLVTAFRLMISGISERMSRGK